jgi:hypothetical protein
MTRVPEENNLMALTNPRRNRIAITNFPIQTLLRLPDGRRNPRIEISNGLTDIIHIPRLEPGLCNVFCVLVCEDPVEFFAVAEGVLHEVYIRADPDVNAFFVDEFAAERVFF